MPFLPELRYFYLCVKQHIEQRHNIECIRADSRVRTEPFLEKIIKMIRNSDIILADCTNTKPNVMYEIGIAHTLKKKVILLSRDEPSTFPSDIRHYEFIRYGENETELFRNLDDALKNILIEKYDKLHTKATKLYNRFSRSTTCNVKAVTKDVFIERVKSTELSEGIPDERNQILIEKFLLPKIVADNRNMIIAKEIAKFLKY